MKRILAIGAVFASLVAGGQGYAAILAPLELDFKTTHTVLSQKSKLEASCAYLVKYVDFDEAIVQKKSNAPVELTHVEGGFKLSLNRPLHIGGPLIKNFETVFQGCDVTLKVKVQDETTETSRVIEFHLGKDEKDNLLILQHLAKEPLEMTPF